MKFEFTKKHLVALILGILVIVLDMIFFVGTALFVPIIIVALTISWSQFWVDYFIEKRRQKEIESKFPEFVRNLVGAIKSGMPVSRGIIYIAKTDYGPLSPYVVKLANQIEWAIPVHKALMNFARETRNGVIQRSIATVIEAEMSGGNMEDVLETVTNSVMEIKKIKLARKTSIHSQLVQSYIIFIVFLGVMVVIQNLLIPYIADIETKNVGGIQEGGMALTAAALGGSMKDAKIDYTNLATFITSLGEFFVSIKGVFLSLALIQALFAGLVLGKLAEGDFHTGVKHSLILMTVAFFIMTLAQGMMG